ncbi:hypothetical protein [Ulvibacterium sp.]|uniref:hypothetical protein n=1 Tax=Ulvibacterium sp. TaxID=2665914 RepID=UPI003BA9B612
MLFKRTEIDYKETLRSWGYKGKPFDKKIHDVKKTKVIWWFLFIPVLTLEKISSSEL